MLLVFAYFTCPGLPSAAGLVYWCPSPPLALVSLWCGVTPTGLLHAPSTILANLFDTTRHSTPFSSWHPARFINLTMSSPRHDATTTSGHGQGAPPLALEDGRSKPTVESLPSREERDVVMPVLQRDEVPTTSKWEIWSWYGYYVGANGVGPFNFAPTAFQNILAQAAAGSNLLHFAGRKRNVNSIVLICNGISFAIQVALFLVIGAYADFGTGRRWILLTASIVAYGTGFAWIGVHDANQWKVAAALYIAGLITYQVATTYWIAAFPSLARNTQHLKDSTAAYRTGDISQQELAQRDELERSRLSNVAFWTQSVAEVFLLAIIIGLMFALKVADRTANNNWGLSVLIAVATGYWVACSIPWFFIEKTRPGLMIPPGKNMLTAGVWQLHEAFMQIWRLRQSLIFLVGYFFLGDSLNTTVTLVATLQNQLVGFDTLELTYLLILNISAQVIGISAFWSIQKRFNLSSKTMFSVIMLSITLLDAWGMTGNWTTRLGFHNIWEIWVYQVFYGLLVCPWYSYAQIMISSVTPRGHEFLFFSVFNIVGKTSSLTGPFISSAIIDATPGGTNDRAPFFFLFALSIVSAVGIFMFLDVEKSAREQDNFLSQKALRAYAVSETNRGS